MRVKISRVAKNHGIPRAFTVKVNGKKYPRGNRDGILPTLNFKL